MKSELTIGRADMLKMLRLKKGLDDLVKQLDGHKPRRRRRRKAKAKAAGKVKASAKPAAKKRSLKDVPDDGNE